MTIEEREQAFKNQVNRMIAFPGEVLKEFFEYWTEPNKSGTKMRYELEKTWDLKRRLNRWQLNQEQRKDFPNASKSMSLKIDTSVKPAPPKPTNMIEELDQLLEKYTLHPTEIPFSAFATYYEYMKQEKLLKSFTGLEVAELRTVYKGDNQKCRSACVQMTLDGYVKSGITFGKIMELRVKLA